MPAICTLLAGLLAFVLVEFDRRAVARNPAYRKALHEQVEHIAASSEQKLSDDYEIEVVRAHIATARRAVGFVTSDA